MSIALPLSVGTESVCELLDFELEGAQVTCEEIMQRLNAGLIDGVRVLRVYENGRKLKELSYLQCIITLEYDNGVPENAQAEIKALFYREEVFVTKKTKNGLQEQNIIPMIQKIDVAVTDANTVTVNAVVCCQNPSLNPALIASAVDRYLPDYAPDFSRFSRVEILDQNHCLFR